MKESFLPPPYHLCYRNKKKLFRCKIQKQNFFSFFFLFFGFILSLSYYVLSSVWVCLCEFWLRKRSTVLLLCCIISYSIVSYMNIVSPRRFNYLFSASTSEISFFCPTWWCCCFYCNFFMTFLIWIYKIKEKKVKKYMYIFLRYTKKSFESLKKKPFL